MKMQKKHFNDVFSNEKIMEDCLDFTQKNYRVRSCSLRLYKEVLAFPIEDKFTGDFTDLLYATLDAWDMNARRAKLAEFDLFSQSIISQKKAILKLKDYSIQDLKDNESIFTVLEDLFNELTLTETNAKLVTFAKTMHFLLPDLIAPIDRKFTFKFFYGNHNIPGKSENQFLCFKTIHRELAEFAIHTKKLQQYSTKEYYNKPIPKLLDDLIIGKALKEAAEGK